MNQTAPALDAHGTLSVTCTISPRAEVDVSVYYTVSAIPPAPARQMRNRELHFLTFDMFVDAGRTRYWGNGYNGTFVIEGALHLSNRNLTGTRSVRAGANPVGTLVHPIYGRVEGAQGATLPGNWLGAVVVKLDYDPICGTATGTRGIGTRSGVR